MAMIAFWALLPILQVMAQERQRKEISLNREKELIVTVDVAFGEILITRGESSKIVVAEFTSSADRDELKVDYSVRNETGELVVRSKDRSKFWRSSDDEEEFDKRKWVLRFTDAIPITFRIELGAGKGDFNLSGLQIRKMKISSGASAVSMSCDKPNLIHAETIDIESGVSKFTATNLVNTNFRRLKFSGGVGAYKLDFGGTLRQDADARIEVGLGAVTINLPRRMPAQVIYDDSWFSSFDLDNGFSRKKSGVYETEGYRQVEPSLSIKIESGLGSVKVRRSD